MADGNYEDIASGIIRAIVSQVNGRLALNPHLVPSEEQGYCLCHGRHDFPFCEEIYALGTVYREEKDEDSIS